MYYVITARLIFFTKPRRAVCRRSADVTERLDLRPCPCVRAERNGEPRDGGTGKRRPRGEKKQTERKPLDRLSSKAVNI